MLAKIYSKIIDYVLPQRCFSCSELSLDDGGFCPQCWSSFNFITKPFCKLCGRRFALDLQGEHTCLGCIKSPPNYDIARAIFKFDENSKKLIHSFKYYDKTILGDKFAEMAACCYRDEFSDADLIIPVPMHKLKRLLRMYNQAAVFASSIGKMINKPVAQDVLFKRKWTGAQTLLNKAARLKNISGTIALRENKDVRGKKIILVDDVMTTGATITACAKVLKKAGAERVTVICVAAT